MAPALSPTRVSSPSGKIYSFTYRRQDESSAAKAANPQDHLHPANGGLSGPSGSGGPCVNSLPASRSPALVWRLEFGLSGLTGVVVSLVLWGAALVGVVPHQGLRRRRGSVSTAWPQRNGTDVYKREGDKGRLVGTDPCRGHPKQVKSAGLHLGSSWPSRRLEGN